MFVTAGCPEQFENFFKNILIHVKHKQKAINAFISVLKWKKDLFSIQGGNQKWSHLVAQHYKYGS